MTSFLDPLELGTITLPNRCIMAPMTRPRVGPDGIPTQTTIDYFTNRTSAGLIITGGTRVSELGAGLGGETGIHNTAQQEAWRHVVRSVHERDGRIFCQLYYGGAMAHPVLLPEGRQPVAPSPINVGGRARTHLGLLERVEARAMEIAEIESVITDFRAAATTAIAVGFDGVEVHACSGYLLEQFICSGSNRRTDRYGNGLEGRSRLVLEVLDAVISAVGADRTGIKISPEYNRNRGNDVVDSDPVGTYCYLVSKISERTPAYLQVADNSDTIDFHALLRPLFSKAYFAGCGFDRQRAVDLLAADGADGIVFGKSYIANPDLFERLIANVPFTPFDPDAPDVIYPSDGVLLNRH